jgi:hypothetical protein
VDSSDVFIVVVFAAAPVVHVRLVGISQLLLHPLESISNRTSRVAGSSVQDGQ